MWILDLRSRKLRRGPSMLVAHYFTAVGLVDEKIYVFEGCEDEYEEIQAEVFDPKTQTWEVAPNPYLRTRWIWMSVVSPSLDGKIYARNHAQGVIVYDTRDGKCEKVEIPNDKICSKDVCVIGDMLYIYYSFVGLMWYDSKKKESKAVKGLELDDYSACEVAMAEYNGKLALVWDCSTKNIIEKKTEIWCAMVALDWSGLEIMGKVEWSYRILSVPRDYTIMHCLGRTN